MCILFEIVVRVFSLLSNCLFLFFFSLFMLSCESSLYILDTSSLGDTIYNFSKSVACLFILLVQISQGSFFFCLNLMRVLSVFPFTGHAFAVKS